MTCPRCNPGLCICKVARPGWSAADAAGLLAIVFGLVVGVCAAVLP